MPEWTDARVVQKILDECSRGEWKNVGGVEMIDRPAPAPKRGRSSDSSGDVLTSRLNGALNVPILAVNDKIGSNCGWTVLAMHWHDRQAGQTDKPGYNRYHVCYCF